MGKPGSIKSQNMQNFETANDGHSEKFKDSRWVMFLAVSKQIRFNFDSFETIHIIFRVTGKFHNHKRSVTIIFIMKMAIWNNKQHND